MSYPIGDANKDGKVNIKDATAIQKVVAGLAEFPQINGKRDECYEA